MNLIIVDEAHRLKYSSLEELRDLQERWNVGIALIGDPGMERSLARTFHFADRVRYLEKFEPLGSVDLNKYTDKQAELLSMPKPSEEVYLLIAKYTRGNPRMLGHLFAIIQRLLKINEANCARNNSGGIRNSQRHDAGWIGCHSKVVGTSACQRELATFHCSS